MLSRVLIIWCAQRECVRLKPRRKEHYPDSLRHCSGAHVSFHAFATIYLRVRAIPALKGYDVPLEMNLEKMALAKGAGFLLFTGVTVSHAVTLFVERDPFRLSALPLFVSSTFNFLCSNSRGHSHIATVRAKYAEFAFINLIITSLSAHSYLRESLNTRDYSVIDSFGNEFTALRIIVW